MKPAAFEVVRPSRLSEAAEILVAHAGEAKLIAGGQSLGPMLNLRLARPSVLVDITGLSELVMVQVGDDHMTIGACVTTADVEDGRAGAGAVPMLARVAQRIAYRAVRNRGTVGGSLCHADPAADWITTFAALGADCIIADGRTKRSLPVARLMAGAFETALAPGEILEAIRIPKPSPRARWGYYKVCRKAGEFALAIGAVLSDPERGTLRAVMGATNGAPIVVDDARALFRGGGDVCGATLDADAAGHLLQEAKIAAGSPRRQLHLTALARAADEAARP
jgi:carbon-monoxide dehydrogenase medium subunit